jgi:REP element-mobilizing transposase RayT
MMGSMPRKLRVEYPGAIYHVMSRGDRRDDIFLDDVDRQDFLKTLAEASLKTGWQVHAYCLMRNHFHLVIETPNANLVEGMRWLLSAYTIRLNHRHQLFGHVFSGRYKALIVDGGGSGYLKTVCDYVHLNPVRARLIKPEDRLLGYPWSSLGWYVAAREHRPAWMRVDRLLGGHGIASDSAAGRREFESRMEARRLEESDEESLKGLRRGWCLGSEEFKREMLQRMDGRLGENHSGEQRQESADARAGRILAEELKRLGWKATELARRRKSDPDKLAIAARLRRETTLTIKSIAVRVQLGTSKGANSNLHSWMKAHPQAPVTPVRTEPEKRKTKTRPKGAAHNSRKTGRKQKSTR